MTRIAEKKTFIIDKLVSWCFEPSQPQRITSGLSLSIMETRTLAMRIEHVTNIATPKGKLGIVSLVEEELAQVYFKTTHKFLRFHLLRERVPNR